MANIALLPGGFKPPHAGHYAVAKFLSQKSGAEVLVRVGAKERDNVTQNMSIKIWGIYGIKAEPASSDSPIADVFKYVEEKATQEDTIYVGTGEKDFPRFKVLTDPSFKPENYKKYNPKGVKVIEIPIPPQAGGVSGTKMREFIKNDQKDLFQKFLPDNVDKDKIWNIVLGLKEDLYDPNDHVLDYMKSSEWKAGMPDGHKEDDIEPGYKYRRGGMYTGGGMGAGGMYESRGGESEMHIYDFDETIARVETPIPYTVESPDGKIIEKGETTSVEFEKTKDFLKDTYDEGITINWDFKAFANLISKGTLNNEVFQKLLDSIKNPNAKVTILTARAIGLPVTKFLKDQGIWAYVVPLGLNKEKGQSVTGEDKANWIEKRLKDTTKKVTFIDDAPENRKAIYALRDKYTNIEFNIEDPTAVNEKMSTADIDVVDTFADKQLDPVDVDLTSNHFFNRLNDPRNQKEISQAELIGFFKRLARKKDEFISFLKKYKELVVHDNRTNLNIPFMKSANKVIAKTVMRKKDFHTPGPKLALEEKTTTFSQNWWKQQITEVLTETKANTHLTHLEELILTQGQDGFNQAKSFLYELIKNLKGESNNIKNVSVKWDGAPAIWAGINPDNAKFFVGTKSIFNKEPKINYTSQDIDKNHGHAAGLAKKLKLALQYLPAVGIKGILQGDFMFDNDDVQTEDIDGTPHYTFKPNTIRYAIEANSELGKQIIAARIGIIFHTTYNDLSGGGASFGADISGLSKSPSVWFDDAYFKDDTGVLLSDQEEKFILEKIKEADSVNVDYTNLPLKNLNTYLNSEIRQGEFVLDPQKSFEKFKNWYQRAVDKSIEKVKRPESKERKKQAGEDKLREFNSQQQDIINVFKLSKLLSEAKAIFITKYDKAVATKHFIDNGDGTLSVTKAEGFVAVDHTENGIKLVDRLEFSRNNFNAGKPGAKK